MIDRADLPEIPPELLDEQLVGRMGIEIVRMDASEVVGRMPVAGNRQMIGLLHGGANAVLAETLGSLLAALNALPERFPLGLELSCTHHRSARTGVVTGKATPIHLGRGASTSNIVITDAEGRCTCTARFTALHHERRPIA